MASKSECEYIVGILNLSTKLDNAVNNAASAANIAASAANIAVNAVNEFKRDNFTDCRSIAVKLITANQIIQQQRGELIAADQIILQQRGELIAADQIILQQRGELIAAKLNDEKYSALDDELTKARYMMNDVYKCQINELKNQVNMVKQTNVDLTNQLIAKNAKRKTRYNQFDTEGFDMKIDQKIRRILWKMCKTDPILLDKWDRLYQHKSDDKYTNIYNVRKAFNLDDNFQIQKSSDKIDIDRTNTIDRKKRNLFNPNSPARLDDA